METKLLPCPFCGSDNCWTHEVWNRHTDHAQGYYVECYDCGAMKGAMIYHNGTWDGFYKTEAEAIEAWNTRHERTCDGCKHLATSMRVDYHIDPCCECVRNAPDLYEPKEETDAD